MIRGHTVPIHIAPSAAAPTASRYLHGGASNLREGMGMGMGKPTPLHCLPVRVRDLGRSARRNARTIDALATVGRAGIDMGDPFLARQGVVICMRAAGHGCDWGSSRPYPYHPVDHPSWPAAEVKGQGRLRAQARPGRPTCMSLCACEPMELAVRRVT
jgi:hypothetical protein